MSDLLCFDYLWLFNVIRLFIMQMCSSLVSPDAASVSFSEGFWAALGGKKDYQSSVTLQRTVKPPRLFGCSNKTGRFIVSLHRKHQQSFHHLRFTVVQLEDHHGCRVAEFVTCFLFTTYDGFYMPVSSWYGFFLVS